MFSVYRMAMGDIDLYNSLCTRMR